MMYYVYILYYEAGDRYYVGQSSDPWRRVLQHNEGKTETFTGKYSDWELKAVFSVSENRSDAMRLEKLIKKQKNKKLLERLIDPEFELSGHFAQLVRVPHVRD